MVSLPVPNLEPGPIGWEEFMSLTPEKFELVKGYLFDAPDQHRWRENLLAVLLTNEGLKRAVHLAPRERWEEALQTAYTPGGKRRMTYEEFLAWCDEDTLAEWVDGEVVHLSPASRRHQELVGFLWFLLKHYADFHNMGVVLMAPFQMKTGPDLPGREPDILFVARDHLGRLKDTFLAGPADLVVEVVSPESIDRDRGRKFVEYERGGVAEYWLIDPLRQQAEFYHPGPDGRYRLLAAGGHGRYESRVIAGLWLNIEWLWAEPLPSMVDTLRKLGVVG
jgi:Uma2 family endonuclease